MGDASAADVAHLLDRLALTDLVASYARRCDRGDADGTAALFTPDGELRIFERGKTEPVRERLGREAITMAMAGLSRYDATLHVVANHTVELDGDEATGEVYCLAHHIRDVAGPDGAPLRSDYVMHIRYLDRYRRTDEGWRIAQRHLHLEFTEDRPVAGP
jgi:ketosteroid isomerase-like protein